MTSENSLSFFGAGGHSHDGSNSTLIDVRKYSIFDFSLGYKGTQARINSQATNQRSFEEYIVRIVNSQVLKPAGLNLDPDILNGKAIRANTITSSQIQANTITASEIQAGTITASEITSNLVLVDNIIRSTNFDGTFHANGVINSTGTTGWAVSYAGSSVFNSATIRGRLTAGDIYIPSVASPTFSVNSSGVLTATSASVSGVLTAGSGSSIGGWTADSTRLYKNYNGTDYIELAPGSSTSTASVKMFQNSYSDIELNGNGLFMYGSTPLVGAGADWTGFYIDNPSSGLIASYITYDEVMAPRGFIDSRQNVSPALDVKKPYNGGSGDQIFIRFLNALSNEAGKIRYNGSSTVVRYDTTSDIRLKKEIKSIKDALSVVEKFNPVSFKYIDTDQEHHGFIAQELFDVYSKSVYKPDTEEGTWSIDYGSLTTILTAAIKELAEKVNMLEAIINNENEGF